MLEDDQALTPLGEALEDARESLQLSKREAAKRAGISEGRWRQVVTGIQKAGNTEIKVRPRRVTVERMARAVGFDVTQALDLAGFPVLPESGRSDRRRLGGVPSPDAVIAWAEEAVDDIWSRDGWSTDEKQEVTRQLRERVAGLLAINDRLKRTA